MSTTPSLKPREVIKILKRHGFVELRQIGSHLHLYNSEKKLRATVPMHNKDLKTPTLRNIIKQSGMTVEEFAGLL